MGRAGKQIAQAVKEITAGKHDQHICILCGTGNNGGDGFSAALILAEWGYRITVYSLPDENEIRGDADFYHKCCLDSKISILYGSKLPLDFPVFQVVIDALLGTGFKGKLKKEIQLWVEWANRQKGKIIAVDIPSGVQADSGKIDPTAIRSDLTISMGYLKVGLTLEPGKTHSGIKKAVDIGLLKDLSSLEDRKWSLLTESDIRTILKPINPQTNKSAQGKVLLISGSTGKTGAAYLCAAAALRTGAGLTISAAPLSLNSIYENKITEGMTFTCEDQEKGRLTFENFETIIPWLDWCDAVAIGPGLGAADDTMALVKLIIEKSTKPVVLDADGLKVLIKYPDILEKTTEEVIITPHYGEFGKISNLPLNKIKDNPLEMADKYLQDKHQCILVLKNAPTCIFWEDAAYISSTGNPGLATAGTGDILTGMIAGFLAQGYIPKEAARLGVYFHGLAADLAVKSLSQRAMIASDLFNEIPKMFKHYE